jgi:3-oxoacyl-[acyl-carrier-protein] synthase-3
MLGKEVSRCCIREVPRSITRALEINDLVIEDVDLILLHQGSKFIVESIGSALGAADRTPFYAQKVGNTCCSSIPLGLARLLDEGGVSETLVLSSFGVGLSWGSTVIRLSPELIRSASAIARNPYKSAESPVPSC